MPEETKKQHSKRVIIVSALLSTFFLTLAAGLFLYSQIKFWTPFQEVNLTTTSLGQEINVDFKTKVPSKIKVEYGTSDMYLNETEPTEIFDMSHDVAISSVLPNKKHFVRLIAYTEEGKSYTSDFFTIE